MLFDSKRMVCRHPLSSIQHPLEDPGIQICLLLPTQTQPSYQEDLSFGSAWHLLGNPPRTIIYENLHECLIGMGSIQPMPCMYGIFTCIWSFGWFLMVILWYIDVGKYTYITWILWDWIFYVGGVGWPAVKPFCCRICVYLLWVHSSCVST